MPLSSDEVRHLAHLVRLSLSEDEIAQVGEQVSEILDYARMIQAVDTDAIPPTAQVVPRPGVMRRDEVTPSLPLEQVLANAPATRDGYFVVGAVLEAPGTRIPDAPGTRTPDAPGTRTPDAPGTRIPDAPGTRGPEDA